MAYTDDDRAAALAALEANNGNVARTSRETGVGRATLNRWASETGHRKEAADARLPEARASIADRLEAFIHQALDVAPDKLADADMNALFRAIGISADKIQLLRNRPTSIDEVRDGLSDDERAERVAALLDRARARRAGSASRSDDE